MLNKFFLIVLGATLSVSAWGHSPMFMDYYKFDQSNGGESVLPQRTLKTQANGSTREQCLNGDAAGYPCNRVDLLGFMPKADLGAAIVNLNDIWGWTDPVTGAEIAIVGTQTGTAFVDITDPENPSYLGTLAGRGGREAWRDIKVFNDHAFIVADGNRNATHGLQVFDLSQLRDVAGAPIQFTETAHLDGFGAAHNIAINEDTGYAYVVGANRCSGGLYMVDISSPRAPSFVGCFSQDGYTHDAQCVIYNGPDTEFIGSEVCVAYNEDTITVVDVSDKANPTLISRTPYLGSQYTHQGWFLDDNHSTIIMNDELDEIRGAGNTTSYIYDLSDLRNPIELGRYRGPTAAIDHNLYTRDGLIFQSNYRAGLRILSSADIANGNLEEVAFFDVIPNSNDAQFSGAWSNYVDFASGNIILTDIGGGLFIVQPDYAAIGVPQNECFHEVTFEADSAGWQNGNSSCATGNFIAGTPEPVANSGVVTQPGSAAQGSGAWFTASNTSAGSNDVDGGTCETLSPLVDASSATAVDIALSYFHGQRDGGDDASDGLTIELLNDGAVVDTLITIGDERTAAEWRQLTAQLANPGELQLRVRATDGASAGDLIEAGIDNVSICAAPTADPDPGANCSLDESFEGGANDWLNTVTASCSTGSFIAGIPNYQANGGVVTQVGSAADGTNALFTATNTSVGRDDVDGGTCVVESPTFNIGVDSTLSMAYFHGQRDAGDDADDSFRLDLSTDGGATFQNLISRGDVAVSAQWNTVGAAIPAGSDVVVRVGCADGANNGDLIECGIDNVKICPN